MYMDRKETIKQSGRLILILTGTFISFMIGATYFGIKEITTFIKERYGNENQKNKSISY